MYCIDNSSHQTFNPNIFNVINIHQKLLWDIIMGINHGLLESSTLSAYNLQYCKYRFKQYTICIVYYAKTISQTVIQQPKVFHYLKHNQYGACANHQKLKENTVSFNSVRDYNYSVRDYLAWEQISNKTIVSNTSKGMRIHTVGH